MQKIRCSRCGKPVSTAVPVDTVVRAFIECPECIKNSNNNQMKEKTLHNSDVSGATKNVSDLQVVGNGDMFQLLCKASSQEEGWMKSTKAMEVPPIGCVVQVTTQQKNPDGSYAVAEALTFVPGATIVVDDNNGRRLSLP